MYKYICVCSFLLMITLKFGSKWCSCFVIYGLGCLFIKIYGIPDCCGKAHFYACQLLVAWANSSSVRCVRVMWVRSPGNHSTVNLREWLMVPYFFLISVVFNDLECFCCKIGTVTCRGPCVPCPLFLTPDVCLILLLWLMQQVHSAGSPSLLKAQSCSNFCSFYLQLFSLPEF